MINHVAGFCSDLSLFKMEYITGTEKEHCLKLLKQLSELNCMLIRSKQHNY